MRWEKRSAGGDSWFLNWRRYTSFTKTALISGAAWSVYHYPLIVFADYNSGTPTWFALLAFTWMVVASSFVYAWLRLKSGSLWTAVILHASHNLYIQDIFDPLNRGPRDHEIFHHRVRPLASRSPIPLSPSTSGSDAARSANHERGFCGGGRVKTTASTNWNHPASHLLQAYPPAAP